MIGSNNFRIKLEIIFSIDYDVDHDKATWIWPGENVLCLNNSKEKNCALCPVHAYPRVYGNRVLLNVCGEYLLISIFI